MHIFVIINQEKQLEIFFIGVNRNIKKTRKITREKQLINCGNRVLNY